MHLQRQLVWRARRPTVCANLQQNFVKKQKILVCCAHLSCVQVVLASCQWLLLLILTGWEALVFCCNSAGWHKMSLQNNERKLLLTEVGFSFSLSLSLFLFYAVDSLSHVLACCVLYAGLLFGKVVVVVVMTSLQNALASLCLKFGVQLAAAEHCDAIAELLWLLLHVYLSSVACLRLRHSSEVWPR